jgi:DNA-binding NtrC family response regulator
MLLTELLVGVSLVMQMLRGRVERAALREEHVAVTGETGTGKEVVARALHRFGRRARETFRAVAAPEFAEGLLSSELFGHERGAFTGAHARKEGAFEGAGDGILFLDEVGELLPPSQAALLRVLGEGVFRRVGGAQTIDVRCRLVTATWRCLREEVELGRFRADLYHRLSGIEIHVPALRERREDIAALVRHRVKAKELVCAFAPSGLACLQDYAWPGNVRQLFRVVEQMDFEIEGRPIEEADLLAHTDLGRAPPRSSRDPGVALAEGVGTSAWDELDRVLRRLLAEAGGDATLARINDRAIQLAMDLAHRNEARAAKLLGMPRRTLGDRLDRMAGRGPGLARVRGDEDPDGARGGDGRARRKKWGD